MTGENIVQVRLTRFISDKTKIMDVERYKDIFPPLEERMGIEEMLLGYTINGAKQLGIEAAKGSIEAGKDADYLVFDTDLLTADPDGLSNILPVDVFNSGQKMHYNPFNPDDQGKEE